MKLLQINEKMFINIDFITCIVEDEENPDGCWIKQCGEDYSRFCDRYSAQQLMSMICEEVYYGDNGICKEDK